MKYTLRYLRFVRSRDDTLAFVGVAGLALLAGFIAKDVTDDFLFRSNAKELWATTAMLLTGVPRDSPRGRGTRGCPRPRAAATPSTRRRGNRRPRGTA